MYKYLTEFIGTFFLVLTVGCTVMTRQPGMIPPLAIGACSHGRSFGKRMDVHMANRQHRIYVVALSLTARD